MSDVRSEVEFATIPLWQMDIGRSLSACDCLKWMLNIVLINSHPATDLQQNVLDNHAKIWINNIDGIDLGKLEYNHPRIYKTSYYLTRQT